jgi:Transposase DDE domain group 1
VQDGGTLNAGLHYPDNRRVICGQEFALGDCRRRDECRRRWEPVLHDAEVGLNRVLQDKIGYLLKRPVGRPPHEVRRYCASFSYQAQSWNKSRRVVAKVEWHPSELYPRVGFIVTNLARPAERVVAFYNQRALRNNGSRKARARLNGRGCPAEPLPPIPSASSSMPSPTTFGNFMRTPAMPKAAGPWSLTSLREKLIKIGAKVVSHGRYVTFQMAEVAMSRQMFQEMLSLIARVRAPPAPA